MNLENAVSSIYRIVDQHQKRDKPSPFFFIVGAGISSPPIKLARDIEAECKETAMQGYHLSPNSSKPSDTYAHWLLQAHKSAKGIQEYLRHIMEGLPISKANLRLAHLLLDGRIAKTVFTPNFDDMLERSLQLFGAAPLVCDHPATVSRMDPNADDIQIIHVHGSYWFYDCCNLPGEITDRSRSEPMSQVLDYFLHNHSPIVVGYSGWEGDILMNALERRLKNKLGYPIYWFCYRKIALDALPDWLKSNTDIHFIFPDELPSENTVASLPAWTGKAEETSSTEISRTNDTSVKTPPSLPSDEVFDALVEIFKLDPPEFTKSPLQLYAKRLKEFLGTSHQDTFYSFHTVISRVEKAATADREREPERLGTVYEAMSQAKYEDVIHNAYKVDLLSLDALETAELVRILLEACSSLKDDSEEKFRGYQLAANVSDSLLSKNPNDTFLKITVAKSLTLQARSLTFLKRHSEALTLANEVLRKFESENTSSMDDSISSAFSAKGFSLGHLNKTNEGIDAYNDLLSRFSNTDQPLVRERVAVALRNKGVFLLELGRDIEALATYNELLGRFGDTPEPALRREVATALRNKGVILTNAGRGEEALATYDELLARFSEAEEPLLREQVAATLRNKGVLLAERSHYEESLACYNELFNRFGNSEEIVLREHVAPSLINKGITLSKYLARSEEGIDAYNDLLARFDEVREPFFREHVAKALRNKGVLLSMLGRNQEAIAVYDDFLSRFGSAQELFLRKELAPVLLNKGITLSKLDRMEEELLVYDDLLMRFDLSTETLFDEYVAKALRNKSSALLNLLKYDEVLITCSTLMKRFGDNHDPVIQEQVAATLRTKERIKELRSQN